MKISNVILSLLLYSGLVSAFRLEKRQDVDDPLDPVDPVDPVDPPPVGPTTTVAPPPSTTTRGTIAPTTTSNAPRPTSPVPSSSADPTSGVAPTSAVPTPADQNGSSDSGRPIGLIFGIIAGSILFLMIVVFMIRKLRLAPSKSFRHRMNGNFDGFKPTDVTRTTTFELEDANRKKQGQMSNSSFSEPSPADVNQTVSDSRLMGPPVGAIYVDQNGNVVDPQQIGVFYDSPMQYGQYGAPMNMEANYANGYYQSNAAHAPSTSPSPQQH